MSPTRSNNRPAKFPDVERASTGGNSDRGYASMTKEEAREIASNLASPQLSSKILIDVNVFRFFRLTN